MKKSQYKSALHVNPGVEQPANINDNGAKCILDKRKKILETENYVNGIISGDRTLLSQAITLIESTLPNTRLPQDKLLNVVCHIPENPKE